MSGSDPLIFLSYASPDRERVLPYFDRLKAASLNVWMDKHSLKGGQNWDFEIKRALKRAFIIVVFISNNSVVRRGYVQREMKIALDHATEKLTDDIYIVPIILDATSEIPENISHIHAINEGDGGAFDALLDSIFTQLRSSGLGSSILDAQVEISIEKIPFEEEWEGLPGYSVSFEKIKVVSTKYKNILEIEDVINSSFVEALHEARSIKFAQTPDLYSFDSDITSRTNYWNSELKEFAVTGTTLSVLMSVYYYFAGAAHPNHGFLTFSFSLEPLVRIRSLSDIFVDPDKALPHLQKSIRQQLLTSIHGATVSQDRWVDEGTAEWSDFGIFLFEETQIRILFPPYQVASYAEGIHVALVPYESIIPLLDSNFQHLLGIAYQSRRPLLGGGVEV